MAEETERTRILRRLTALESERQPWESQYTDIMDYMMPNRGFFTSKGQQPNYGDKKTDKIIDGTATRAIRTLAAGMQGGLTSPARPWFRLGLTDDGMMEYGPVREWLHHVERELYAAYARSNFYTSVHSVYAELAGFGTGAIFLKEDMQRSLRYRVFTAGEYILALDDDGVVDTLYRRYWMTGRNLLKRFGKENVSKSVRDNNEKQPDKWYEVVHAVEPRDDMGEKKTDSKSMPWKSVYIEKAAATDDKLLMESGFEEFPFFCPRWDTCGVDTYGRGPGMDTLPDVIMLQEMQKTVIMALHKQVNPPVVAPSALVQGLNSYPGGITYSDQKEALGPLYEVRVALQDAEAKIERIQMAIREGLFNDLFLMILERPNMTATEVTERHEEKLLMLGPVIERQMNELLDPNTERAFNILLRAGKIQPPPEELWDQEVKVEYTSLLAQSQKLLGTQGINATMNFVGSLANMVPAVLDKVNFDEAVDQYAEMTGVPPKIIRSDDEVLELRKLKAEQAQQQEQIMQAQALVQGAKDLGSVSTNPEEPNALTDLVRSMQG